MYNTDIPSRAELPTTGQLLRSTLIAFVVAVALLVTVVLPAEYGIDPTGVGKLTGLAEMGEIKTQLQEEAEADRLRDLQNSSSPTSAPGQRSNILDSVFAGLFIRPAAAHEAGHGPGTGKGAAAEARKMLQSKTGGRTDEMSVTLKPGQGIEIKLTMKKGAKAAYYWIAEGGKVNFDKHGDGPGRKSKSYKRGRSVVRDQGVLEAAFDGNHGWFWRNRTKKDVTVKLRTEGAYSEIKRVL